MINCNHQLSKETHCRLLWRSQCDPFGPIEALTWQVPRPPSIEPAHRCDSLMKIRKREKYAFWHTELSKIWVLIFCNTSGFFLPDCSVLPQPVLWMKSKVEMMEKNSKVKNATDLIRWFQFETWLLPDAVQVLHILHQIGAGQTDRLNVAVQHDGSFEFH